MIETKLINVEKEKKNKMTTTKRNYETKQNFREEEKTLVDD